MAAMGSPPSGLLPFFLFFLLLLLVPWASPQELRHPPGRIGVIGAGIGGTSAAYFLRQKFGKDVHIDVFEKGNVGGRLATINLEGKDYEAGGSVIHPLNLHMKHFVKELGLSVPEQGGGLFGVYNGDEFVFEESSWYIWNFFKLLWNYGLNFLRMFIWVEEILDKFMRIYRYQSHDFAFSTMESLLHAMGGSDFLRLLNQTIDTSLQKARFSQKFINEMVTPVMRVNYGQNANINGFVALLLRGLCESTSTVNPFVWIHRCYEEVTGAVSLAGADPGLWSVEGGNKLVCIGLLSASKAQLISGTVISLEEKTRTKGRSGVPVKLYEVTYNSSRGLTSELYDILLVATPLHRKIANITFRHFQPPLPEFPRPYHQTVATFVHGQINASFFGYPNPSQFALGSILTMENPKLFIDSIGAVSPVQGQREENLASRMWKVFSREPLTKEQIHLLFSSHDSVEVKTWLAYPRYSPPEKCPPIVLHDHMYYLNSIEYAASAMEMSAIAAKNSALLAYHRWYEKPGMIDQEDLHERLKTEL